MPVAVGTGDAHPALTGLGHAVPMVDVGGVSHIGVRSVDPLEEARISVRGLRVYRMTDLRKRGMRAVIAEALKPVRACGGQDRKSTRLNSSHQIISYAVFCLKKKKSDQSRVPCLEDIAFVLNSSETV